MTSSGPAYDEECFFIAPIGKEGSPVRNRSDGVRDFVVKPAAAELGLATVRADDLAKPGQITLQVIEHVLRAKGVVADLTGANANVFYELAVRHTAQLPVVLIAAEEEIERLPFDIAQMRVIPLNHQDLASAARAKEQITQHLREALAGAVDSPIATALTREALQQGNTVERTLADLVVRVDELAREVRAQRLRRRYVFSSNANDPNASVLHGERGAYSIAPEAGGWVVRGASLENSGVAWHLDHVPGPADIAMMEEAVNTEWTLPGDREGAEDQTEAGDGTQGSV